MTQSRIKFGTVARFSPALFVLALLLPVRMPSARADAYMLGPEDEISVVVLRHADWSVPKLKVSSGGRIQLPAAGEFNVTGKTVNQVANEIQRALSTRIRNPEVTVTLTTPRVRQVFILGAVTKAGAYEILHGWRVSDAIAAAGGMTVRPDLAEAWLEHRGKAPVVLNLHQILLDLRQPANAMLQPGDTIRVVERTTTITVSGAVVKPGTYQVQNGAGAVAAVGLAGGTLPTAAATRARVRRLDGGEVKVNLVRAMTTGSAADDVVLQSGDLVMVPESARDRVVVLGEVEKPGYLPIEDGHKLYLSDAMALAGGPGKKAVLTRATVKHPDGTIVPVDLYKLLVLNQRDLNLELGPDDVVTVPESKGVTVLGDVKNPDRYHVEEGQTPRLADVLAMAGGIKSNPDMARIRIMRDMPNGGQRVLNADAVALITRGDQSQNARIQDGDVVMVSSSETSVSINGEVKTPGVYSLREGNTLPEIIARAGGPTDEAALKRVTIRHPDGTAIAVDAYASVRNGGDSSDLLLQDGDYVVVPKNYQNIIVMGAVNRPGPYTIPENETVTLGKALALAVGTQPKARVHEVAIFTQTPKGVVHRIVSLQKVKNGRLAMNEPVFPGDVIYVPEGKVTSSAVGTIVGLISTGASIAAVSGKKLF